MVEDRRAILAQFLIEAGVLSTVGGIIGILLGVTVSVSLSTFAGWAAVVGRGFAATDA